MIYDIEAGIEAGVEYCPAGPYAAMVVYHKRLSHGGVWSRSTGCCPALHGSCAESRAQCTTASCNHSKRTDCTVRLRPLESGSARRGGQVEGVCALTAVRTKLVYGIQYRYRLKHTGIPPGILRVRNVFEFTDQMSARDHVVGLEAREARMLHNNSILVV